VSTGVQWAVLVFIIYWDFPFRLAFVRGVFVLWLCVDTSVIGERNLLTAAPVLGIYICPGVGGLYWIAISAL
jgi:hypothetical protein